MAEQFCLCVDGFGIKETYGSLKDAKIAAKSHLSEHHKITIKPVDSTENIAMWEYDYSFDYWVPHQHF